MTERGARNVQFQLEKGYVGHGTLQTWEMLSERDWKSAGPGDASRWAGGIRIGLLTASGTGGDETKFSALPSPLLGAPPISLSHRYLRLAREHPDRTSDSHAVSIADSPHATG